VWSLHSKTEKYLNSINYINLIERVISMNKNDVEDETYSEEIDSEEKDDLINEDDDDC